MIKFVLAYCNVPKVPSQCGRRGAGMRCWLMVQAAVKGELPAATLLAPGSTVEREGRSFPSTQKAGFWQDLLTKHFKFMT